MFGLVQGHRELGHEVTVAAVLDRAPAPDHPFLSAVGAAGATVETLVCPGRAYAREWRWLSALMHRLCPDVVHTHGYRSDVLGGLVARRRGVAHVSTVHGFTGGGWRNRLYERLQVWYLRRADRAVAVARPIADRLRAGGVPESRLLLLQNAWDGGAPLSRVEARAALGLSADVPVIGWVGRMSHEKAPDVLLDAFVEAAGRDILPPGAEVVFVGDGPERGRLEAAAAAAGLGGRVRFAGGVQGAGRLMPAFDLFALSSRTEGTPIVLLEAMAARVPVVATRVGGVPDVVSPAESVLVPAADPAALATALAATLRDPAGSAARAAAARDRLARDFARGPWLATYERLYRAVRRSPDREIA